MTQAVELLPIWQRALAFLEAADWPAAEGLILRLQQMGKTHLDPIVLADALAYCRLSQGDHHGCLEALEPFLLHPARSFWLSHKAGDAWRGLGHIPEAIRAYRQAIADGSDSELTYRNLLLVLEQHHPDEALLQLNTWYEQDRAVDAVWLKGAQLAAELSADRLVLQWLWERGSASPQLIPRCLEDCLYRLDFANLQQAWHNAEPSSLWELALRDRLIKLGLLKLPT